MLKRSTAAALTVASLLTAGAALLAPRASISPAWAQAYVNGAFLTQAATGWNEAYNGTVAASASFNGATRVGGTMGGALYNFDYFQATCYSNVAGTLSVFGYTASGGNPVLMGSVTIVAGGTGIVKVPAFGVQFLSSFSNTSTNVATFTLSDGFTGS